MHTNGYEDAAKAAITLKRLPDLDWVDIVAELRPWMAKMGTLDDNGEGPKRGLFFSRRFSDYLTDDVAASFQYEDDAPEDIKATSLTRDEAMAMIGATVEAAHMQLLHDAICNHHLDQTPDPMVNSAWGNESAVTKQAAQLRLSRLPRDEDGNIILGFIANIGGVVRVASTILLKENGQSTMYVAFDDELPIFGPEE